MISLHGNLTHRNHIPIVFLYMHIPSSHSGKSLGHPVYKYMMERLEDLGIPGRQLLPHVKISRLTP